MQFIAVIGEFGETGKSDSIAGCSAEEACGGKSDCTID
ncbi:unnamed protein product [Cylicostephanus goldi]|uniref:Uncharacterized protein n=1 Tax=Cylicostephanus goldi TaxID=71465 RepID=A0A3P6S1E9_CYLGO|nr:unnamed protein product [Cylicostephanus goldi]